MSLKEELSANIIGQEPVLRDICALLARAMAGFRYPDEPLASILSLGPTGVGKTESILIACNYLFGPGHLARFDMSEYNTHDGLNRMLGGKDVSIFELLFEQTKGKGVVLFDEIEKAFPLVLDVLLQILSAGRVTIAGGRVLDLHNYIIWGTSNIGALQLVHSHTVKEDIIAQRVQNAALEHLRPEILNRFNLVASYNKLGDQTTLAITELHVKKCLEIAAQNGHNLTVHDRCVEYIRRLGYSEAFGARPIKREAMRIIGDSVLDTGPDPVSGEIDYDFTTGRYGIFT